MRDIQTNIDGCVVLSYNKNEDNRGSFTRLICKEDLRIAEIDFDVVQSSVVFTKKKGTIRGMHFQNHPKPEGKLVTCVSGSALYVVVDMRGDSKTFKEVTYVNLFSNEEHFLGVLYIPPYCASGYQTLEDNTQMLYYMDEYYDEGLQTGVNCYSEKLDIKWLPGLDVTMSAKDKNLQEMPI